MNRIESLTEILPYVRAFHGKVFVVKLGGEVCEPIPLTSIATQISLLHHIGVRVVVVHGGGLQMAALLKQMGVEAKMHEGRRITDEPTLRAAKMLYAGLINTDVVSALQAQGAKAVGLTGVDAGLVTVHRRPVQEIKTEMGETKALDFQFVGDVDSVKPEVLEALLDRGMIPVVSCLGVDAEGQVYNVNADTVASRIAQRLAAHKLIFLTGVPGILARPPETSSLISYVDVEALQGLIEDGTISGGMLPKVHNCIEAVLNGVNRTHIIDGGRPDALLLEIFVNEGCGTMIVSQRERLEYEKNEVGE